MSQQQSQSAAITSTRSFAPIVDTSHSPHTRLQPVGLDAVQLTDAFWEPRRQVNRAVTLRTQYQQCQATGRLDNFRRAAGRFQGPFQGIFYNDSDVYKWLEAACWTLATDTDAELAAWVDEIAEIIAAAQDATGYLNTYFTFEHKEERWTNLRDMHELYCAGHFIQAAIAHHRTTGKHLLLDVAVRLADHIITTFGPSARPGTCGHPEIEMALVELARETGNAAYLHEALFFIDQRGQQPPIIGGHVYLLDHAPFREQSEVVGHAVRALYLYTGATDVYAETGEQALVQTIETLWHDLHEHKIYLTGGAGSRYEGEAFGAAYELPNGRAYTETCASIAHVMWNWRMLLLRGEARFADALENALYNGVLSGISLDGQEYFYQNPLEDRGQHRRLPWFSTACCPPNIARLLASLPGYIYTTSQEGLWVHQYASNTATTTLPGGETVTVKQQTAYPWDGRVEITLALSQPATFSVFLRIPAWSEPAEVQINAASYTERGIPGSYLEVRRAWQSGDKLVLALPMPVRLIESHPHVTSNYGRVAVTRGPLVYCAEQVDHPGVDVWDIILPQAPSWELAQGTDPLDGVTTLHTQALTADTARQSTPLYTRFTEKTTHYSSVQLTMVPYYIWANREAGPMQVWLPLQA